MISMRFAGTLCWVITGFFETAFLYETQDHMTRLGIVLKTLTSLGELAYAIVLIALFGQLSDAAKLFVAGLALIVVGDLLLAIVQERNGGSTEGFLKKAEGGFNASRFGIGVAGVLFIVAYFLQLVAFIKGLSARDEATNYVMPFLVFFLLPPMFTYVTAILAKFRVPDVATNIFIIGVFYILLTSALFSSSAVFSFSVFQEDPKHASWIFLGAMFFFLSTLFVLLRYCLPSRFDTKTMRATSRVLTFFGRMILAGCAFMF